MIYWYLAGGFITFVVIAIVGMCLWVYGQEHYDGE